MNNCATLAKSTQISRHNVALKMFRFPTVVWMIPWLSKRDIKYEFKEGKYINNKQNVKFENQVMKWTKLH